MFYMEEKICETLLYLKPMISYMRSFLAVKKIILFKFKQNNMAVFKAPLHRQSSCSVKGF